jgi:hypothetical protein
MLIGCQTRIFLFLVWLDCVAPFYFLIFGLVRRVVLLYFPVFCLARLVALFYFLVFGLARPCCSFLFSCFWFGSTVLLFFIFLFLVWLNRIALLYFLVFGLARPCCSSFFIVCVVFVVLFVIVM